MNSKEQIISVLLTALMATALLAGPAAAAGTSPSADSNGIEATNNDEIVSVTDEIGVWERSMLPLRASADGDAELISIPNQKTQISSPDGEVVNVNRNTIEVFQTGEEINLTFESTNGANPDQFADEDVQLLVGHLDENVDEDASSLDISQNFQDELTAENLENLNENVTFSLEHDFEDDGLDDIGEGEFTTTSENAGFYGGVLAVDGEEDGGDGFSVDDTGNVTIEDSVNLIGVEQWVAQDDTSDVTVDETAVPGSDITFDVDATELNDDVTHAVTVYNEETFAEDGLLTFNVTEDFDSASADDLIIEHRIDSFNGVQSVDDDVELFGEQVSQQYESGTTDVSDLVSYFASEVDQNHPQTEVVGDGLELNTSTVVIGDADADTELTVETFDNWTEGDYRWIHTAAGSSSGEIQSQTGTIEIADAVDEAFFDVEITDVDSEVVEGETIELDYAVENTGDEAATQTIDFEVDGTVVDSEEDVTVEGGETFTGEFTYTTDASDSPEFDVTVTSDDDDDTRSVTVTEPPAEASFEINDVTTNEPVTVGEELAVTATIENLGDETGTQDVELVTSSAMDSYTDDDGVVHTDGLLDAISDWRNDDIETSLLLDIIDAWRTGDPVTTSAVVDTEELTLEGGETDTVSLTYTVQEADAPQLDLTIQTEDDSTDVSVTIEQGVAAYADDDGVVRTDGLLDSISDWRSDDIESSLLLDVIDAWRTGDSV